MAAFAFLVALALQGERPDAGLAPFKASGLLTAFSPDQAREVEVAVDGRVWRFRRAGAAWRAVPASGPEGNNLADDPTSRIDTALRLLRDAGPLRVLTAAEVTRTPETDYALGPQALQVTVHGPDSATFVVRFGGPNPLGSARYTRVAGVGGIPLLPTHVADAWEQVIGRRQP